MKFDPDLRIIPAQPLNMFRIDSWGSRMCCPDQPARDYRELLHHAVARLPVDQPLIVMVHGSGFSPFTSKANAQNTLYARHIMPNSWQNRSWPLRFAPPNLQSSETLAIGWAWHGTGKNIGATSNVLDAFEAAQSQVKWFASFVAELTKIAKTRRIHVMCHGMGAHIVLQSFRLLKKTNIQRVLIMDGHAFCAKTLLSLNERSSRGVDFYNLIEGKNKARNRWVNYILPKSGPKDQLIALGFLFQRSNWADIELQSLESQKLLQQTGLKNPKKTKRSCRWSFGTSALETRAIVRILFGAPASGVVDFKSESIGIATRKPITFLRCGKIEMLMRHFTQSYAS